MSEVIVRMEMPKDCYDCPMYDFASYRGKLTLCCNAHLDLKPIPNNGNPRPSWCPIIGELPEHGDLIDRDELKKHKRHSEEFCENIVSVAQIDWMPTIVPATERRET